MNRHERRRVEALKTKEVMLKHDDIPKVCDVFCIVEPRGGGNVTVAANGHGRECLQKVFPRWSIPWKPFTASFPSDWLSTIVDVPNLARRGDHQLPMNITGGTPLEDATPAAVTLLLAFGARNQGARVMKWDEDGGEHQYQLFRPSSLNN